MCQVMIITGSRTAEEMMWSAIEDLIDVGVDIEIKTLVKNCSIYEIKEAVTESKANAFVVGSSMATSLASYIAAFTSQPVIGVPLDMENEDDILDLFKVEGLPTGTPYMITDIDDGKTAAKTALEILKNSLLLR
ncbi:AIR carboxylase family protein [Candidatus Saccharibacteria bacterium]|nr:AIR carboxylase family protein [Candidatus Saccharibacteria bacterium]